MPWARAGKLFHAGNTVLKMVSDQYLEPLTSAQSRSRSLTDPRKEVTFEQQQMSIFSLTVKRRESSALPPIYVSSKRLRPSSLSVSASRFYIPAASSQNPRSGRFDSETRLNVMWPQRLEFSRKSCHFGHDTVSGWALVKCSFPTKGANHLHLYTRSIPLKHRLSCQFQGGSNQP